MSVLPEFEQGRATGTEAHCLPIPAVSFEADCLLIEGRNLFRIVHCQYDMIHGKPRGKDRMLSHRSGLPLRRDVEVDANFQRDPLPGRPWSLPDPEGGAHEIQMPFYMKYGAIDIEREGQGDRLADPAYCQGSDCLIGIASRGTEVPRVKYR